MTPTKERAPGEFKTLPFPLSRESFRSGVAARGKHRECHRNPNVIDDGNAAAEIRRELLETVRRELGPLAVIGDLHFVQMRPKTRSGKIMRRVLKAVTLDRDPGDITTIEDEGSVEEAREAWRELRRES